VLERGLTVLAAGAIPATLAFESGGYFPSEWGVELLVLALLVLVAVLLAERPRLRGLEWTMLLGLVGLAAWTALSVAWSPGAEQPVLAAELALVYAAGVAAVLLAGSRDRVGALLFGVLAGIVAVALYALETRLIEGRMGNPDDPLSGTRLVEPIGYANALGALMAVGLVLAAGFAVAGRTRAIRSGAGAALVPLAAALYLTLSRGSYVAAVAGVVALLAFSGWQSAAGGLLLVLPSPLVAVVLSERSPLTSASLDVVGAKAAGHRLAWELALLAVVAGAAGIATGRLGARAARWAVGVCALAAVAVVAGVAVAGPVRLADRVLDRLREPPPVTSSDINRRVLSVSGSGRTAYWRVAIRMVERRPLLGEGGGSFERWWLQERPVANNARNAHSLYLETLAELGPVGLALLVLALAVPLAALRRARRDRMAAAAAAAYLAWLVHAALDWDWQIPAITLAALACGCAVVLAARRDEEDAPAAFRVRAAWIAALVPLLAVALVANNGNRAVDAAQKALVNGDDARAAAEARRAQRWLPWASSPWRLLGEAETARREDAAARVSLRHAVDRDGASWIAWYDLATVTTGGPHAAALCRARELNPLAPELIGLR
jgi:hypothetical protein